MGLDKFSFDRYLAANGQPPSTNAQWSDLVDDLKEQRLETTMELAQRRQLIDELKPAVDAEFAERGWPAPSDEDWRQVLDDMKAEANQARAQQGLPAMTPDEWASLSTDMLLERLMADDDDDEPEGEVFVDEDGQEYVLPFELEDEETGERYEVVDEGPAYTGDGESSFDMGQSFGAGVRSVAQRRPDGTPLTGLEDDEARVQATAEAVQQSQDNAAYDDLVGEAGGDEFAADEW